jgi:clusterin-associated protein 1
LGSQITLKGAALYDLLGKEVELREKRNNVLARQLEITEVEQALRSSVKTVEDEIKVKIPLFINIRETFKNEAKIILFRPLLNIYKNCSYPMGFV